jgi:hypothetical protein
MSDIGGFPGLLLFLVALATAALGGLGLVVQVAVVAVMRLARPAEARPGEPRPGLGSDVALAVLGPLLCIGFAGTAALVLEGMGSSWNETLAAVEGVAMVLLPATAVALWAGVQVALVLARRARARSGPRG